MNRSYENIIQWIDFFLARWKLHRWKMTTGIYSIWNNTHTPPSVVIKDNTNKSVLAFVYSFRHTHARVQSAPNDYSQNHKSIEHTLHAAWENILLTTVWIRPVSDRFLAHIKHNERRSVNPIVTTTLHSPYALFSPQKIFFRDSPKRHLCGCYNHRRTYYPICYPSRV